jgi:hypothetical protein
MGLYDCFQEARSFAAALSFGTTAVSCERVHRKCIIFEFSRLGSHIDADAVRVDFRILLSNHCTHNALKDMFTKFWLNFLNSNNLCLTSWAVNVTVRTSWSVT